MNAQVELLSSFHLFSFLPLSLSLLWFGNQGSKQARLNIPILCTAAPATGFLLVIH